MQVKKWRHHSTLLFDLFSLSYWKLLHKKNFFWSRACNGWNLDVAQNTPTSPTPNYFALKPLGGFMCGLLWKQKNEILITKDENMKAELCENSNFSASKSIKELSRLWFVFSLWTSAAAVMRFVYCRCHSYFVPLHLTLRISKCSTCAAHLPCVLQLPLLEYLFIHYYFSLILVLQGEA